MNQQPRIRPLSTRPALSEDLTGREPLDVVDAADNVLGWQWRHDAEQADALDFRVVDAFVIRPDGRIWIPVRSRTKHRFPGCLDFSAAGHVRAGESYLAAIRRELTEETHLNPETVTITELGHLRPPPVGLQSRVYRVDVPHRIRPVLDPNEHSDGLWLTPLETLTALRRGVPAKDDMRTVLRFAYATLTHCGAAADQSASPAPAAREDGRHACDGWLPWVHHPLTS